MKHPFKLSIPYPLLPPPPSPLAFSISGGVHGWDLRAKNDVWTLSSPASHGLVEHLVAEPCPLYNTAATAATTAATGSKSGCQNWILCGTSSSYLTLWDLRFHLPVNTWQHPLKCPIDGLALAIAPPARLGLGYVHTSTRGWTSGPMVYVAAGRNEVGLWDVAAMKCHQVRVGLWLK